VWIGTALSYHSLARVQRQMNRHHLARRQLQGRGVYTQAPLQPECCQDGTSGMVLLCHRSAEQDQETLARQGLEGSPVLMRFGAGQCVHSLHDTMQGIESQLLDQGGGVGHHATEHRDQLALPGEGVLSGKHRDGQRGSHEWTPGR
jgi:hypothetical protein